MRLNKNTNKAVWSCLAAFIICAAALVWLSQDALALRVSLKRVVFEGSKRSEILTIINASSKPETYRLEWLRFKMEDGKASLTSLEDGEAAPEVNFADEMIRFAPRRVTVPPGGSQQVRLLLRRPKDLEQGEYRAHLRILTEAESKPFSEQETNKPAVRLSVQPGISLPVFVRHGKLEADVSISDAKLATAENGLEVSFRISRTGDRSVYGDFDFVCNDGGEEKILHTIRGIAVYAETSYRDLKYKLNVSDTTAANCSKVDVVYRADANDNQYGGKVLAQATATR